MKIFFIAGLVMLNAVVSGVNAQAPATQWQRAIGGGGEESAYSIELTRDGGYIIAGSTNSTDGNLTGVPGYSQDDCWIVKVASNGNIEWQKRYGSSGIDLINDIKQTSDGGYIFTGRNNANDIVDGDVTTGSGGWLVKLSEAGNIEWQTVAGSTGLAVSQAADGGYWVGGSNFVAKYTSAGINVWLSFLSYAVNSIDATTDGGVIITGEATTANRADVKVVKLNSQGTVVADKELGTPGYEGGQSVIQTSDGGYIVAGYASGVDVDHVHGYKGGSDAWVVKLNSLLDTVWTRAVGGTNNDIARKIIQVEGGYMVAGETGSTDGDITGYKGGAKDAWIFKLDNNGSLLWQQCLGGSSNDIFYDICRGADGGYLAAGHTYSNDGDISGAHGSADLWMVKLDEDQVLPVTFGTIDAFLRNGALTVNWTSQKETNNAYYLVEASKDGKHFVTISYKVFTQAPDGNSDIPLQYAFTKSYIKLQVLTLLLLSLSITFKKRKSLWLLSFVIMVCTLSVLSCRKNGNDIADSSDQNLYIRVVQVDADGQKSYSKVITAIRQ
jgi:hypothetical protein